MKESLAGFCDEEDSEGLAHFCSEDGNRDVHIGVKNTEGVGLRNRCLFVFFQGITGKRWIK